MALGAVAAAPTGFVEFCERQPADCAATPAELANLSRQRGGGATTAATIQFDWTGVFAAKSVDPRPSTATSTVATAVAAPASYDWSEVFAKQPQPALLTDEAVVGERVAASARVPGLPVASRAGTQKPAMSPALWGLITKTNERVNRAIVQRTDLDAYGVAEIWSTPIEAGARYGDCEDYVLEKRRALIAAGVAKEALSIAVVSTFRGESHAVLLINTTAGEYVLDNLSAWVLPWGKTPYQWRERQVAGSASDWAFAAASALESRPARLLLANAG